MASTTSADSDTNGESRSVLISGFQLDVNYDWIRDVFKDVCSVRYFQPKETSHQEQVDKTKRTVAAQVTFTDGYSAQKVR